jgi:hypothetical protein
MLTYINYIYIFLFLLFIGIKVFLLKKPNSSITVKYEKIMYENTLLIIITKVIILLFWYILSVPRFIFILIISLFSFFF